MNIAKSHCSRVATFTLAKNAIFCEHKLCKPGLFTLRSQDVVLGEISFALLHAVSSSMDSEANYVIINKQCSPHSHVHGFVNLYF